MKARTALIIAAFSMGLFVLYVLWSIAYAGSARIRLPNERNQFACLWLVHNFGAAIAHYHWEEHETKEHMLAIPFTDEVPEWARIMTVRWIHEAYDYKGSGEQWMGQLINQCNEVES